MDPRRIGRHYAEMVQVVGGDEKEGRERKYAGSASAQGGANDEECGGKRGSLLQNLHAYIMERSADLGKLKKRMRGCWTVVKQRGKNGQNVGNVAKMCRMWRRIFGRMRN